MLPIICADFTKLIAADSYVNAGVQSDPEAPDAIRAITDALVNGAPTTYFDRAPIARSLLGPIGKTWVAASTTTGPLEPFTYDHDWRVPFSTNIMDAFARTMHGSMIDKAALWLRCHCGDPYRARLFWLGNSEDDLRQVRSAFENAPVQPQVLLNRLCAALSDIDVIRVANHAIFAVGPHPHELRPDWTPASFLLAYLGLAYLKGYEYAARLDGPNEAYSYLTHFLRETAWNPRHTAANVVTEADAPLAWFPWGTLLLGAFKQNELGENDAYAGIIDALRSYHGRTVSGPSGLETELTKIRTTFQHTYDLDTRRRLFNRAYDAASAAAADGIARVTGRHDVDIEALWSRGEQLLLLAELATKALSGPDLDRVLGYSPSTYYAVIKWQYQATITHAFHSLIHTIHTKQTARSLPEAARRTLTAYLATWQIRPL